MNNHYILKTLDLTKKYGETTALNNVNLDLEYGKVYGLIGRNGAGKTTLLKLISDMLFPTSGKIEINSEHIQKNGDIAFGRSYFIKYFNYKIKDILKIASHIYPNWQENYVKELVDAFELDIKKTYHRSSAGMQTMTSLIIALSANPRLLLLDEPYVGLDPVNREVFYSFLRNHYFDGEKTVLISSHMIKEIEGYFERAVLLDKGKILFNEDLEMLKAQSFVVQGDTAVAGFVERNLNVIGKEGLGNRCTYYIHDKIRESEQAQIMAMGGEIQSMDLQTLMIKMTTKGAGYENKGSV